MTMSDVKQIGLFKSELPEVIIPKKDDKLPKTTFKSFEEAKNVAMTCKKCRLCESRTKVVFGSGNPQSRILFIGEGPGQTEDETGLPFVGKAGQLLDKVFESVEISRDTDLYITNVVKCRPPNNRVPQQDEMEACFDYLAAQIRYIQPQMILLSGATAVKGILKAREGITKIRGTWFDDVYNAKVMPIFHPSYLLRNQSKAVGSPKWLMWEDIKEIKKEIDRLKD